MTYSAFQIYKAGFFLIKNEWEKNNNNYLGTVLCDMNLLDNGYTADPAIWYDWLNCLTKFQRSHFSEYAGLQAVLSFLEDYIVTCYHQDIETFINKIDICLNNKNTKQTLWLEWLECLEQVGHTINYIKDQFKDFEAFKAAQLFLDNHAHTMESLIIESLRNAMDLDIYGYTKDPYAWNYWQSCLRRVDYTITTSSDSEEIFVSAQEAFKAFIFFIEIYYSNLRLKSLERFLETLLMAYPKQSYIIEEWYDCFARLNNNQAQLQIYQPDGALHAS